MIFGGVRALVLEYRQEVAIEKVFPSQCGQRAQAGQARSAPSILFACCGRAYAARAVKRAVSVDAHKRQVQHMVRALLRLPSALAPDEADALAVALCHAHTRPLASRLKAAARLTVVRR
jgi:crossover junction endodeoxyribonuclease RuvC